MRNLFIVRETSSSPGERKRGAYNYRKRGGLNSPAEEKLLSRRGKPGTLTRREGAEAEEREK